MVFRIEATSFFKNVSNMDTLRFFDSRETGLTNLEVQERLSFFGKNEIAEKKENLIIAFLKRFWGPMPWLLELAMFLSFALKHEFEGIVIFCLMTLNAVIGFIHSFHAQKAVLLLKQRLAIQVKVLRNGIWCVEQAAGLVPGDIIALKGGDIIPADAKIIRGNVATDDSSLTGESLSKEKQESDIVYAGAMIRRGQVQCVILNTGVHTYFGKSVELVKNAKPVSHQEEVMMGIIRYAMYFALSASLILFGYSLILHKSLLFIFPFVLIFLMNAVPVALPAVMTIVQAATSLKLAAQGVLVTKLDSIEDASSISILCLDKTGTITQNKLMVKEVVSFSGCSEDESIQSALLVSKKEDMDQIDLALFDYAKQKNISPDTYKELSYIPFSPEIKRTEAVFQIKEGVVRIIKGASQVVLQICNNIDDATRLEVDTAIARFSQKGWRTIAVARSEGGNEYNIQLIGLIAFADPPRPDSRIMIEEIRQLGIKPMMLTGDNLAIAREVATQVGIGSKIITFADIQHLDADEKIRQVEESDGFAEIYPADKYEIVKMLQSKGYMVGMTGDGVNDAPALKQAEVGIALSNSTDVAKASASLVLTRPGLGVIVDAILRSRETYQRMLTWVINKILKVIQIIGLLLIGFFMMDKMVLSVLGMALLVFANDFVTMSLATDNVTSTISPNNWNIRNITLASLIIGCLFIIEGVLTLLWGEYLQLQFEQLQTFVLLMLVFTCQFRVLIVRERNFFWSSLPGKALLLSTLASTLAFIFIGVFGKIIAPLPLSQVLALLAFSGVFTLAIDCAKRFVFRRFVV